MDVHIAAARGCDVGLLAERLRLGDLAEIEAAGLRPGRAVWRSYRGSIYTKAAFVDGELAALWGIGGCSLGNVGLPWLLTTPAVERVKLSFLKTGRAETAAMLDIFPRLYGHVDAAYVKAIRLLESFGFTVDAPLPFGLRENLFRRYHIERS